MRPYPKDNKERSQVFALVDFLKISLENFFYSWYNDLICVISNFKTNMQSNINWLSAMARRGISLGVVTCLALSIFSAGTAEARLVFTNEGDGNLVDTDQSGDGDFSLFFGDDLSGEIEYDTTSDTFTIQNGDNFAVTGNIDAQGDLSDSTGNLTLNDAVDITGALDAQGDISNSTGDVTVNDNLDVTGTSDLQGNVSSSTGNLTLDDAVDVTGALDVQGGDITLQNDETISNSVDGTVEIDATNTDLTGSLDVQGGDITLENDETISNSTDGQIDLNATTVETSNNLNVGGALDVQGGDITLENDETISNSTDGQIDVNANLNVTGTSSLDGNTTVETGASFTVTDGTSTFGGALDVNSTSDFGGDITLSADAQIINLRAQNATTGGAPACADASDLGRIFYDTTLDQLFYCAETAPSVFGFVSTADPAAGTTFATFYAEWASFALYADGSDNIGTVRSQYDNTDDRSYYYFTSRRATTQDYDLVLQWQVPEDFTGFDTGTNHLEFDIETVGAGAAVDLRDVQVNGADQAISDTGNTAATWTTQQVDLSTATIAAGDTLTLRFTLYGDNTPSESRISNVKLNYDKQ